jgi:hypothetical protein
MFDCRRRRGAATLAPPRRGRIADDLLERPAERRLRRVADILGDLGEAQPAIRQQARRHLHAPLCEVLHRRLLDEVKKSIGERGARQPGLARELFERPWMRRLAVQQGERAADEPVAQSGEPPGLLGRERIDMPANRRPQGRVVPPKLGTRAA